MFILALALHAGGDNEALDRAALSKITHALRVLSDEWKKFDNKPIFAACALH